MSKSFRTLSTRQMCSHVDCVVEATALGDGTKNLLMVTSRVDGKNTVDTGWKAVGNISTQSAVLCDTVETLEEGEDLGIQGFR